MPHELSLAYLTAFGIAPPEMIEIAARAGYDAVGLRLIPVTESEPAFLLAHDHALLRQTKQALRSTGLRVLDVELFRLTPECDTRAFLPALDACAELGARHIVAQAPDRLVSRAAAHLGMLCEFAKERGLGVDVEFVTWTETSDLQRAAELVSAADRDNVGILIDTLHFSRSRCNVHDLAELPREWFRYAQVCDAPPEPPATDDALIFVARNERLFLGEGGLDIRAILAALPEDLPYSIEIPRTAFANVVGVEELARLALDTTRRYLERRSAPAQTHTSVSERVHSR